MRANDLIEGESFIVQRSAKVFAAAGAVAIGLSLLTAAPAYACEQPHTSPTSSTSTRVSAVDIVRVTQQSPGSLFGLLEWPVAAGATQYMVYKTGSIRPYWRLFFVAPESMNSLQIMDKPGAIAVYRVVAIIGSREVNLGRFNYRPQR